MMRESGIPKIERKKIEEFRVWNVSTCEPFTAFTLMESLTHSIEHIPKNRTLELPLAIIKTFTLQNWLTYSVIEIIGGRVRCDDDVFFFSSAHFIPNIIILLLIQLGNRQYNKSIHNCV